MKRYGVRLLLSLAGLFLALIICEVALRVAGWSAPIFTTPDSQLGVRLLPNAEGWWRDEGTTYLRINSAGFRDREHQKQKSPGTLRIAVLGDSYAEARQVSMDATFWTILEKNLQSCPNLKGKQVEVLNFGVPGYGTAQELLSLRQSVWEYAPDVVLLAFSTGNDLRDNSPILSQDGPRPFFVYRDGHLVLDDSMLKARDNTLAFRFWKSPPGRAFAWLRQHSRVVQLINRAQASFTEYQISRRRKEVETGMSKNSEAEINKSSGERGLDFMVYYEPKDPAWQEAWHMTEGTIALMRDEVQSKGVLFAVVTLSSGLQVSRNALNHVKRSDNYGSFDLFYPDRRIKALGDREKFPVLNLAPILAAYAAEHKVALHGFGQNLGMGHWNELGHRQAGEAISAWLCEQLASNNEPH